MAKIDNHHLRGLIIDMDGVLWQGEKPLGDLAHIFTTIDHHALKYILATNNATRSVGQYVEKLENFGVSIPTARVINSAQAAAQFLHQKFPQGGSVYILGEEGLVQALGEAEFVADEGDPLAVVVALDRDLTYDKLRLATQYIRAGKPFIATNPDPTLPSPEGLIPGTGAIIAALEAASGVKAIIVGKPQPGLYQVALERLGTSPTETMVIGDRLQTDIAGGQSLGCLTALVLSGASSKAEADSWSPPPDFIADDISTLLDMLG